MTGTWMQANTPYLWLHYHVQQCKNTRNARQVQAVLLLFATSGALSDVCSSLLTPFFGFIMVSYPSGCVDLSWCL